MDTSKVTRFEVIDETGRAMVKYSIEVDSILLQDENRTLKVFLRPRGPKDTTKHS